MSYETIEGYFHLDSFLLNVRQIGECLTASAPGVPEGFEMILEPTDTPHTFTILRGPMAGVTAVFQSDLDGQLTGVQIGDEYELAYSADPPPEPEIPNGQGLSPPDMYLDAGKEADFAALLDEVMGGNDGATNHTGHP